MKTHIMIYVISSMILLSCHKEGIKYKLYSNGEFVFEILPDDIEFYDTTKTRGHIEIHELRLKKEFFQQDSFILNSRLELFCEIGGEEYFWSEFFHHHQPEPRLWVNFNFHFSCKNRWVFQEQKTGIVILRPNNGCNSIEFLHQKKEIEDGRKNYYEKKEYFQNYVDTARLAHEILLDPYYLQALKDSGVPIK